jgi:hypothetical protein
MQRRKYLAAIGSAAAAGAAGIGTGAFTSVTADRSVDVEVAGDSSAYLQLQKISGEPNSQQYVNVDSGEVSFDFSDGNSDVAGGGNGFNPDAVTEVENLLRVGNQGTQEVEFYVDVSGVDLSNGTTIQVRAEDGSGNTVENIAQNGGVSSPAPDSITLTTGETAVLDLIVDTTNLDTSSGTLPFEDDDGTVTFVADQNGI